MHRTLDTLAAILVWTLLALACASPPSALDSCPDSVWDCGEDRR